MTFDDMVSQYSTYVQDEQQQAQYTDLLAHMFEAAGAEAAEGFHDRTIARLAATVIPATPDVQVDLSGDAAIQ
jgi:hypothetical protein